MGYRKYLLEAMLIPDPNFSHFGSRVKKIPDPHQRVVSIFNTKICIKALGNMIRDVHPGSGY
jgi:hypothetical protein